MQTASQVRNLKKSQQKSYIPVIYLLLQFVVNTTVPKKETIVHIGYPSITIFCSYFFDLQMFQDMQKWGMNWDIVRKQQIPLPPVAVLRM